jgi:hypothetical protein
LVFQIEHFNKNLERHRFDTPTKDLTQITTSPTINHRSPDL